MTFNYVPKKTRGVFSYVPKTTQGVFNYRDRRTKSFIACVGTFRAATY